MGDIHAGGSLNLTAELTNDKDIIKRTISHKDIINKAFTTMPKIDEYINYLHERHICYLLKLNGETKGIAIFMQASEPYENQQNYVVDIGIYKSARGKIGKKLSILGLQKFFDSYRCDHLYGFINIDNRPSYLHALWCGFRKVSNLKNKIMVEYIK